MGKQSRALIILMILATSILSMFVLAVPFIQISRAEQVNLTVKDFVYGFLSEVIELDLTKYNITDEGYSFSYPSEYGGNVKREHVTLNLASSSGNISVMGMFLNGFNGGIFVYPPAEGSMLFTNQPSTNAVNESRNILQRYKTFTQNYSLETSHIDPALALLNNVVKASSSSADLHTFNNIMGFVPSVTTAGNMKQEATQRSITWIYTANGVDVPNKCLKIDFGINKLHFVDTWNLYSIGSFSIISKDGATQIALDAANDYKLTLVGENGTLIFPEKPGWSNRNSTILDMIPGEMYNSEVNKANPFLIGGNATRDPLALYPLWQVAFAFNQSLGGIDGIQVGVWGDTSEIAYISEYGHLDGYIPEFPSWTAFLIAGLIATFIVSIIYRRRIKQGRKT